VTVHLTVYKEPKPIHAIQMLFKRGRYNSYYKKPELLEPIFTLFLTEPDASYVMREVSARSHPTHNAVFMA
jgi:hypothetical protein